MSLKKYLPAGLKLFAKLSLRKLKDLRNGDNRRFNSSQKQGEAFQHEVSISQVIRKNTNFENKVHNLQKGIDAMDGIVIQPGEIFSFWKNVGKPNKQNGFQLSRNIVAGNVSEDYGGGLCQLSSIIYHLSLTAGLEIRERFNHSIDIYKEEERFTPLGADATVVYGYKDLRIRNPYTFPVRLSLLIQTDQLQCSISSTESILLENIDFQRETSDSKIKVKGIASSGKILNNSSYLIQGQ